jgi:superfamily I DNA and RNA helicase
MPDLERVELIQRDMSKKQERLKRIRDQYLRELQKQGFTEDQALELLQEDAGGSSRSGR